MLLGSPEVTVRSQNTARVRLATLVGDLSRLPIMSWPGVLNPLRSI
jgi:hypothetical protein